jgi:hypothetical protein
VTAARKLPAPTPAPEADPVLAALARAPQGPSPAPEIERLILEDPSSRQFVPGAAVSAEIAARARAERARRRGR